MSAEKDRDAELRRVCAKLRPQLVGALTLHTGDRAVTEELGQEALVRAWWQWPRVQAMANPASYLYRVARSQIEWPTRRRPTLPTVEPSRLPQVEPSLPQALARLSERQRVAVWLALGCDWSLEEVAGLLGISVSSVRRHVDRGLARVRTQLGVSIDA